MQRVILIILLISLNHLDKTFMQLGIGTCVKGVDKDLHRWILAAADRCDDTSPRSVAEMIRN